MPVQIPREASSHRIPLLSIVLGFGPMLPFVVGAIGVWTAPRTWRMALTDATLLWGCAILLFLAGVRRGLSFRTIGGPTAAQIATMLGLFCLGLAAAAATRISARTAALTCLIVGLSAVALLDPVAAERDEVPPFFARLRPLQMPIAVLALLLILVRP